VQPAHGLDHTRLLITVIRGFVTSFARFEPLALLGVRGTPKFGMQIES
jgi:hypothetical protein